MKSYAIVVMALLFAMPVSANAMTVGEFLNRAEALQKKGMMAMFSKKEINALMAEAKTASDAWTKDVKAAQVRGDKSLGCPPAKGGVRITSDEMLNGLRAHVPTAERATTPLRGGFYRVMKARFPCN